MSDAPRAKQPWMKFYPSDWRADAGVRNCSLAARGLWIEMLCLMHAADGRLAIADRMLTVVDLANQVGIPAKECGKLVKELEENAVFSVDEYGCIFSRRIIRDIEKSTTDRNNGRRGGNPNITKGVNPPVKGQDKAQKPEARNQINSSSTAHGELERECRSAVGSEPVLCDPDFSPLERMIGVDGVTPDDVMAGVHAAMAEPNFRIKHWNQLVGWSRRAAKDRMAGVDKQAATGPPRAAKPSNKSNFLNALLKSSQDDRTEPEIIQ